MLSRPASLRSDLVRRERDDPVAALRRPIPLAALALTLGIACAAAPLELRPDHSYLLAGIGAAALALAARGLRRIRADGSVAAQTPTHGSSRGSLTIFAAFFALGILAVIRMPRPLDLERGDIVTLRGRVETPLLDLPEALRPEDGRSARLTLRAVECLGPARVARCLPGKVVIEVPRADRFIERDSRVEVTGRVRPMRGVRNPGEEDSFRRRRLSGVLAILEVRSSAAIAVVEPGSGPFPALDRLRERLLRGLTEHLAPSNAALAAALLFGERGGLDDALLESAAAAGILHVLAISGAHVALLVVVVRGLLALALAPALADCLAILVALIYADLAGADSPVARAAIGSALYLVGCLIGRHPRPLDSLALAWIVLLLVAPSELFAPGFELSFVACAALLLAHIPLPSTREASSRRVRMVRVLGHALFPSILASTATMPLVLHHFGFVSPLAPLLTILITPLFLVAFASSVLLVVLDLLPGASWLAAALARAVDPVVHALGHAFRHGADLPGASLSWPRPCWSATLLAMFALTLLAIPGHALPSFPSSARRLLRGSMPNPRYLAICSLLLAGAIEFARFSPPTHAELWLFDVGHGQAALLRTPDRTNILFDAGSRGSSRYVSATISRALDAIGIRAIDLAIVTHGDSDHLNALPALIQEGRVERLAHGPGFDAPLALALLRVARAHGIEPREVSRGDRIHDPITGTALRVLAPTRNDADSGSSAENDRSLVVVATIGSHRVLMPGDIETAGIQRLLALEPTLAADVIVLPHHGHDDPWLPHLLERLGGRTGALWLASRSPERGGERVLDLSERWGARYISTARHGALRLVFDDSGRSPRIECTCDPGPLRPLETDRGSVDR